MIDLDLIPESNFDPNMPYEIKLSDINTQSPYKYKRAAKKNVRVKYFERPEQIHNRVDAFRRQVTQVKTLTERELGQILKQMRDDATIHKIFDKKDESDKEDDAANNSDDEGMMDEHAAILRLQTIANPQLLEELKAA